MNTAATEEEVPKEAPAEQADAPSEPAAPEQPVSDPAPAEAPAEPSEPEQPAEPPSPEASQSSAKPKKYPQIPEYHPCSWCGGFRKFVPKHEGDPAEKVHIGQVVKAPRGTTRDLVACIECVYKVYHNICGQAQFLGQEISVVKGETEAKGFFPVSRGARQ